SSPHSCCSDSRRLEGGIRHEQIALRILDGLGESRVQAFGSPSNRNAVRMHNPVKVERAGLRHNPAQMSERNLMPRPVSEGTYTISAGCSTIGSWSLSLRRKTVTDLYHPFLQAPV